MLHDGSAQDGYAKTLSTAMLFGTQCAGETFPTFPCQGEGWSGGMSLALDESSLMAGAELVIDGGFIAQYNPRSFFCYPCTV